MPNASKANIQNVSVWSKERFMDLEVTSYEKMGGEP